MKVLLSWLQEFAPVNGAPEEIGNQLSDLGLERSAVCVREGPIAGSHRQLSEARDHVTDPRIETLSDVSERLPVSDVPLYLLPGASASAHALRDREAGGII